MATGKKRRRGENRKIRKARKSASSAKARHYEKESHRRAYLTPGHGAHPNPGKVKPVKKSTGWMKAVRVKIVRQKGGDVVLIQKPKRSKKR